MYYTHANCSLDDRRMDRRRKKWNVQIHATNGTHANTLTYITDIWKEKDIIHIINKKISGILSRSSTVYLICTSTHQTNIRIPYCVCGYFVFFSYTLLLTIYFLWKERMLMHMLDTVHFLQKKYFWLGEF